MSSVTQAYRHLKVVAALVGIVALLAAAACGSDPEPTPVPIPTPTPLSMEQLSEMMQKAVAAATTPGMDAREIQKMVEEAVKAGPGVTKEDLEAAISSRMGDQMTTDDVKRVVDAAIAAMPLPAAPEPIDPAAIQSLVESAVSNAVGQDEGISEERMQELVQAAVAAATKDVPTRGELAAEVTKSLESAGEGQLTADQVQSIVDAAVSAAVDVAEDAAEEARKAAAAAGDVARAAGVLSGTIEIDGSSTVFPVSEAVAEEFHKLHPRVNVNVGISGTGGGFKRFTVGETDISDASRPIKQSEASAAADNGITYLELLVGTDGLSVVVNPENDFAQCLTVEELKKVWEPGSTINNWSQVRSGFPDRPLRLYGADTDSGTFDYFTEEIVGEAQASRSDYTASADDNVLVQGIGGDRNALGYFGYAYYAENQDKLKLVAIDTGDGCVTPTASTIESGAYKPLSRPLFIYVNRASLDKPEVRAFVEYYLEHAETLVREVGYVPLKAQAYRVSRSMVESVLANLSGTIEIDGSSTVYPVSEAVAEEFHKLHPNVNVNVGISGTGGGFKRFTVGETDISDASRPIKESEAGAAASNRIRYIELLVGTDGLSVVVNPENDFAQCLTVDELKKVWEPGSTINNWSQVRSGFPDRPLRLYGADTDSGTFDYFTEEIVGEAQASRSDYTASADDNVLVQGIGGDRNALGYFGYAYYAENEDKLKLVAIDAGSGCVTPTADTIEGGQYKPLSRPLFIYVNRASMDKPEVKAFVEFYMTKAQQLVREVGYVPLADSAYSAGLTLVELSLANLSGTIEIDGSSTVFPVSEAVAEEFHKLQLRESTSTWASLAQAADSSASRRARPTSPTPPGPSRPPRLRLLRTTASTTSSCWWARTACRWWSSPQNDFAQCLTVDELKKVWEPGSTINNWSQVRSGFPDRPLRLYGADTDSGTFDYFTEEIVGEAQASRSDYTASADDNVLVQGIGGDRNALGYFGYAYYAENQDKLKLIAIDAGEGCVTPTATR